MKSRRHHFENTGWIDSDVYLWVRFDCDNHSKQSDPLEDTGL